MQLTNPEVTENSKTPLLLKDAFNIYLQEIRLPKLKEYSEERRKRNYRQDFNSVSFIYRFFANKKIEYFYQIDDNIIQSFKYYIIHERQNSTASFNRRLVILVSLNKHLSEYTNYRSSECHFSKYRCNESKELKNYLSDIQIENLINSSPLHLQRLIKFFLYTGMRKQNGLDLKWSEIDFVNKQITVQVKKNKTHTIPIIQQLFDLLSEIQKEQIDLYIELKEYVFLYKGGRIKNGTTAIKNSLMRAKISLPKGQLFHVFRHTCAVILVNKGVDLYVIQKILGHSSIDMTQRYARLQTETIANEMERAFGK